ncbi:hypothetical protein ACFSUK_05760 [Sphingobium scionense]
MSPTPDSDPLIEIIRFPEQVDLVVEGLHQARLDWRAGHQRQAEQGVYFPSRQALQRISRELAIALFPLRFGPPELTAQNENAYVGAALESTLSQLAAQIRLERGYHEPDSDQSAIATQVEEIIGTSLPICRRCGACSIVMSMPAMRSTRRHAASMRCCSPTRR